MGPFYLLGSISLNHLFSFIYRPLINIVTCNIIPNLGINIILDHSLPTIIHQTEIILSECWLAILVFADRLWQAAS